MAFGQDMGPAVVTITVAAVIMASLAFFLRCYVRIRIQKDFTLDDYLLLLSYAFFLSLSAMTLCKVRYGLGKHLLDVILEDVHHLKPMMMYSFLTQLCFSACLCCVKVCVAIFFRSLRPPPRLRLIAAILAWITIVSMAGYFCFTAFKCSPTPFYWHRLEYGAKGTCLGPNTSHIILQLFNTINLFTDIGLAVLPAFMVRKMNMSREDKIVVSLLLGLGALPSIVAFARSFFLKNFLDHALDYTYAAWPVAISAVTETATAILVVSIIRLRPFIRLVFPERWHSVGESIGNFKNVGKRQRQRQRQPRCPRLESITLSILRMPQRAHIARSDSMQEILPEHEKEISNIV